MSKRSFAPRRRERRGIALLATLSLLAVLGMLLGAAVASMTLAGRSARLAELDGRLDAATDFALNSVLSDPEGFGVVDGPFGRAQLFVVPSANADVSSNVTTTRLRGGLTWVVAESWLTGRDRGARRANAILRVRGPTQLPAAPLVARGSIDVDPSVTFDTDTSMDAECGPPSGGGVRAMQSSDSGTFYLLAAQRALFDSAPNVTRFAHDTTIGPGTLEGIVLADGALTLVGPLRVSGLVVARGVIGATLGVSIEGALMSFDSSAKNSITLNRVSVRYSPCAVARAFRRLHPPQRLHARTWLEVF